MCAVPVSAALKRLARAGRSMSLFLLQSTKCAPQGRALLEDRQINGPGATVRLAPLPRTPLVLTAPYSQPV